MNSFDGLLTPPTTASAVLTSPLAFVCVVASLMVCALLWHAHRLLKAIWKEPLQALFTLIAYLVGAWAVGLVLYYLISMIAAYYYRLTPSLLAVGESDILPPADTLYTPSLALATFAVAAATLLLIVGALVAFHHHRVSRVLDLTNGAATLRDSTERHEDGFSINITTLKAVTDIVKSILQPEGTPSPPQVEFITALQLEAALQPIYMFMRAHDHPALQVPATDSAATSPAQPDPVVRVSAATAPSEKATTTEWQTPRRPVRPATPPPSRQEAHSNRFAPLVAEESEEDDDDILESTQTRTVRFASDESSDEFTPLEGIVNTRMVQPARAIAKRQPRRQQATAQPHNTATAPAPLAQSELLSLVETAGSEDKLVEVLLQRRAERRDAARLPTYLTEAEKAMPASELWVQMKLDRQRQRNKSEQLHRYDLTPLEELTEQEKLLPRLDVHRILSAKANERWARETKALGGSVVKCQICQKHSMAGKHQCYATPIQQRRAAPPGTIPSIVVTQTPTTTTLRQMPVLDEAAILAGLDQFTALKEELDKRKADEQADVEDVAMSPSTNSSTPTQPTARSRL